MAFKGNQKRVLAGKKGGRPKKMVIVATEAVAIDEADGDVEMADEEQPAAAEAAAAEKTTAEEEEQPAYSLLALPWNFWDVVVLLQHRPLMQTRLLGLAGTTCKFFRAHLDTVYKPNAFGRLINTRVRRVYCSAPHCQPAQPAAPLFGRWTSSDA